MKFSIRDQELICRRLKRLRLKRGLSMKAIAAQIKVPLTTYRNWEYGRAIRGEPYERIAQALGVDLTELLTGKKPRSSRTLQRIEALKNQLGLLEIDVL